MSQRKRHILGRENNCDIQILDKGVSRTQSVIEFKKGFFLLIDLGAATSTFVNNATVISKNLKNGDIIRIGHTELLYVQVTSNIGMLLHKSLTQK